MLIPAEVHVVKVFMREREIPIQVLFPIQARPSVLIVKQ